MVVFCPAAGSSERGTRGMEREQAPPTGRRRVTPPMIAAQAACPTEWDPARRGQALSALKRAAPALGVPRRVVELVDYLVGCTQEGDWEPGARPMAWPSNATLGDALDLGRTQVKTVIRLALEYGLVAVDESANGHRRGWREGGKSGPIVEAWGFDLTPLAARRAEFEQIAAAHAERRREGRRLRRRVAALSTQVLGLSDAGAEQGRGGADWPALAAEARALLARRGASEDPGQLAPLVEQLEALRARAQEGLAAAAEEASAPVETDPKGPEERPHITPTNLLSISRGDTAVPSPVGPDRPRAQESRSSPGRQGPSGQQGQPDKAQAGQPQAPTPGSALRGFVMTPDLVLRIAPQFRDWVGTSKPSWAELGEAATFVRSELGISLPAWGQACVVLGRMEAISVLAVIAARQAAGQVRSPGGLLRRMVELHLAGGLRLDRTLFGLMEGSRAQSLTPNARPTRVTSGPPHPFQAGAQRNCPKRIALS